MPMPYRESDETADFRAYTPTLNRGKKGGYAAVVSLMLMLLGIPFALRYKRPFFLVGLLPLGHRDDAHLRRQAEASSASPFRGADESEGRA